MIVIEERNGCCAGSRQVHFFRFAFFTVDFLAPFFALLFPLSAFAAW